MRAIILTLLLIGCAVPMSTIMREAEQAEANIVITGLYYTKPNYAGGVDVRAAFVNTSGRTVKYVYFYLTPYNSVGDIVACRANNKSTVKCTAVGKFENKQGYGGGINDPVWRNVWFNSTTKCIVIDKVEIEYMDGDIELVDDLIILGGKNPCNCCN